MSVLTIQRQRFKLYFASKSADTVDTIALEAAAKKEEAARQKTEESR